MGLLEDLRTGAAGVRVRLPEGELLTNSETCAQVGDPETRLVVTALKTPWRLDLEPRHEPFRLRNCLLAARHVFAEAFVPDDAPPPFGRQQPRTADPSWSPVIEIGNCLVDGLPAFRTLYRITYQPGNESIVGHLLIPVADGTVELTTHGKAEMTGTRESVLYVKEGRQLTQAEFDDPAHDQVFQEHVLARVRRALAAFAEAEVTAAPAPTPGELVDLPASRGRLRPPPGFALVPPGTLPLAPTIDVLARITLRTDRGPELLDVYWIPGTPPADLAALSSRARAMNQAWEQQGVEDVDVLLGGGHATAAGMDLAVRVSMTSRGERKLSRQRWLVRDGRLVRLARTVPAWESEIDADLDLDAAVRSWEPA